MKAIDAADAAAATARWADVTTAATTLQGNAHHYVSVDDGQPVTHLRVNLYPDGGLARLRVYGQPPQAVRRAARAA